MGKVVLLLSGPHRLIIDSACYSASLAFIAAHIFGRYRFFGKPFPFVSDFFLVASWVVGVLQQIVADYYLYTLGFWDPRLRYALSDPNAYYGNVIPDEKHVIAGFKVLYATGTLYLVAMYFIKMVFLLSYVRLFTSRRRLWMALMSTITVVTLGYFVLVAMNVFYCKPIRGNWTIDLSRRCTTATEPPVYFLTAILHLISDIVIFALPFFALSHIKSQTVSSGARINIWAVRGMFSLGFLCVIIPVVRLSVSVADVFIFQGTVYAAILTSELTLPLIVACLPMVRRLWIAHREDQHVDTLVEVENGHHNPLVSAGTSMTVKSGKSKSLSSQGGILPAASQEHSITGQ